MDEKVHSVGKPGDFVMYGVDNNGLYEVRRLRSPEELWRGAERVAVNLTWDQAIHRAGKSTLWLLGDIEYGGGFRVKGET